MMSTSDSLRTTMARDLTGGLVVFLVALPLCLGIALASGAPLFSGLISGVIGGVIVGAISGSHVSVSGPGNTLMAIVATQIATLGFETFLLALAFAGVIQIALGAARLGFLAAYFPSSVIKGLLAAIGTILVLKQIPHLLGHGANPEGHMAFQQQNSENTFSALVHMFDHIHRSEIVIGLGSLALLFAWARIKPLRQSAVPPALLVVLFGMSMGWLLGQLGRAWRILPENFVQVPVADSVAGFLGQFQWPDFSQWSNPAPYLAGLTIAAVASLETLLNLEAADKIDPQQRTSPPSRELLAQGIGNLTAGLIGGIPVTSVIVRSSVNINAGSQTKLATIIHGILLLVSVALLPFWLNQIPLACLAAILIYTGIKLASPKLVGQMWKAGVYQFVPFALTLVAIVFTDLLIGILLGLAVSLGAVLNSNRRRPIRRFVEKHLGGDVLHIELANQVSFLNRASLLEVLDAAPRGGHVLLDAQNTDYIDPDVLDLLHDFTEQTAPARGVKVSLLGFRRKYQFQDRTQYVDYSTRELQSQLSPQQVVQILKEGHERFRTGERLTRDLGRLVHATAAEQHPLAVVLSCIDSRAPAELIFDLGLGDIFSIRIAGNIISREVLGSMEYACAVAGAKLIVVMGHTRCGAVTAAVDLASSTETAAQATGCQHIEPIVQVIQQSIDPLIRQRLTQLSASEKEAFVDATSRGNVSHVSEMVLQQSQRLSNMHQEGRIAIIGAMYDIATGKLEFMPHADACVEAPIHATESAQRDTRTQVEARRVRDGDT
ncbi:MAG: sulfate transporter [Gemmataceae bacterium]|nr:sulfate transporter [Gemmataceae bacterium]